MHIHIMGIAGTFMAGLGRLAKAMGHTVTGSDKSEIYPPMSTQLEDDGIQVMTPYSPDNLNPKPDLVIVGNAVSRGNPEMEAVLKQNLRYVSGPQWLHDEVLHERHVLAVAGTHGKTTTTNMLTTVLKENGIDCGYLIGGVPRTLEGSANLGTAPFFVIEADEYDSAFFDKRSKFIHYAPRTLVLNNVEFDHADIFKDIEEIKKQFNHLIRTVPGNGLILHLQHDAIIQDILDMGLWTPTESFDLDAGDWRTENVSPDGSQFDVMYQNKKVGTVNWELTGMHNVCNALATIGAAHDVGVKPEDACKTLSKFVSPKRRMEVVVSRNGVTLYDDFAHHPTAFIKTLNGLRAHVGDKRIIVLLEMRSYTMRTGFHGGNVMQGLSQADEIILLKPEELTDAQISELTQGHPHCSVLPDADSIMKAVLNDMKSGDHIVMMSNGSFGGLRGKLTQALS